MIAPCRIVLCSYASSDDTSVTASTTIVGYKRLAHQHRRVTSFPFRNGERWVASSSARISIRWAWGGLADSTPKILSVLDAV